MPPAVSDVDARDDAKWFTDHPDRRYRARPGWVVRRRSGYAFLRTPTAADCVCSRNERCAEDLSWSAACPDLDPKIRHRLTRAARRSAKL
jgi:hypothetical protein